MEPIAIFAETRMYHREPSRFLVHWFNLTVTLWFVSLGWLLYFAVLCGVGCWHSGFPFGSPIL